MTKKKDRRAAPAGAGPRERETPARREARSLLMRRKARAAAAADYQIITEEQARALTDRIIPPDLSDEQAHAFVILLRGIVAAYYAERRGGRHNSGDVEA